LPIAFTTCTVVAIIGRLQVWRLWVEIVLVLDT
jgi:hypothetical protein